MGVVREEGTQSKRTFVGKAWKNVAAQGEHKGTEYINLTIDQDFKEVIIEKGNRLMLWPNDKREGINEKTGKEYADADFRVSLIEEEVKAEA